MTAYDGPMYLRERPPCRELQPYVRILWCATGCPPPGGDEAPQCIPPDGCMELVLNFGDRVEALHADGAAEVQPRTMLVGEVRRPSLVRPLGAIDILGVRFSPAGISAFAEPPLMEIVDRTFDILDVLPRTLVRELEAIVGASPPHERMARVEGVLLSQLARRRRGDALVSRAVAALEASGGGVAIADLAHRAGLAPRQLERRFLRAVGVSPKSLAQVLRFQRVLAMLTSEHPGWVHVAAASGYYDQAHLIRDFKRFTGATPRAFLRRDHPFADLFLPGAAA